MPTTMTIIDRFDVAAGTILVCMLDASGDVTECKDEWVYFLLPGYADEMHGCIPAKEVDQDGEVMDACNGMAIWTVGDETINAWNVD